MQIDKEKVSKVVLKLLQCMSKEMKAIDLSFDHIPEVLKVTKIIGEEAHNYTHKIIKNAKMEVINRGQQHNN